jgi:hypothetical protein
MAYTKYSLTPANNTAAPPDGAPEGMLPSAVNDTMRDMMAQIRDAGDGIRDGTYTMTAPKITGGTITGSTINNSAIGGTTAAAGKFTTLEATGVTTVQAGTVSLPAITTTGDTNTGIFFPAADTIAFTEGGVESMRIDSSGNVGVGITNPNSFGKLVVKTSSTSEAAGLAVMSSTNDSILTIYNSGSVHNIGATYSSTGSYQPIAFVTSGSERMRINAGAPILCLAGGNTSATGTGIAFPATQSASSDANTLDDYEEGTFTPTVIGSTSAGTATYSAQNAKYTKIGRVVEYEIYMQWSAGNGTGNLKITGLPFTASATTTYPAPSIGYLSNIGLTANNVAVAYIESNSTTIAIEQYPVGGGGQSAVAYDGAGGIILSGCYSV